MCGIAGILHFGKINDASERVHHMADAMIHRGPDDHGYWFNQDCALGVRRLAIVDLADGRQPMTNEDASVIVAFNGEIYNHADLRRTLQGMGHRFTSDHSDTEVLVHGYEEWGPDLLAKLNGMYALAVVDTRARSLLLARDRLGIKPLYLCNKGDSLIFASEVRGLVASGLLAHEPNPAGVLEYMTLMNNWRGRTPFRAVQMLAPGTWLRITPERREEKKFWSLTFKRSRRDSSSDLVEEARAVLGRVFRRQASADVPIAAYLSGGIDSSAIAAGMRTIDPALKTYSCIFDLAGVGDDRIVDEREYSRAAANELGVTRIEYTVPQDSLITTLEATIAALEYPCMGMSYANYLIAQRVAKDGKVVMSGIGGDEFTAGYVGRYALVPRGEATHHSLYARLFNFFRQGQTATKNDPLAMFSRELHVPLAPEEVDQAFTPEFRRAASGFDSEAEIRSILAEAPSTDPWDRVMYADAVGYLHGLLVMEDKLSMIHSLETRVPLLDNEWIDLMLDIPWEYFSDGKTGKMLFREVVRPWVPDSIYHKPKMGFGPPDASWYRQQLRQYVLSRLTAKRIAHRGIFNPNFVARKLDEHMSGKRNSVALIWSLLSIDAWCDTTGFFGGRIAL